MSGDSPPAGWYEDGQTVGMRRWWNGEEWTNDLESYLPSIPAPPKVPSQFELAEASLRKLQRRSLLAMRDVFRRPLLVTAAVAAVAVAGVAAAGTSGSPITVGSQEAELAQDPTPAQGTARAQDPGRAQGTARAQGTTPAQDPGRAQDDTTVTTTPPASSSVEGPTERTGLASEPTVLGTQVSASDPDAAFGSPTCHPHYSGCVPNVDEVDCLGDGDGPVYFEGPVRVLGADVYDLDRDGDGIACER